MIIKRSFALGLCLVLSSAGAQAAQPVMTEIDALLDALGQSGCDFYRNGTWYDATRAEAHLRRKLDYIAKRESISSSEAFIEAAATRSSFSGEAYQVRCPGTASVPSADWLRGRLQAIRVSASDTP